MWYDAMRIIQNCLPDATFTPPNGNDVNGVLTTVPDVGGQPFAQAAAAAQAGGLHRGRRRLPRLGLSKDTVAYTSPGGGTQVASGTTVTIYRSDGTPYVPPRRHHGGNHGGPGNGHHGH